MRLVSQRAALRRVLWRGSLAFFSGIALLALAWQHVLQAAEASEPLGYAFAGIGIWVGGLALGGMGLAFGIAGGLGGSLALRRPRARVTAPRAFSRA